MNELKKIVVGLGMLSCVTAVNADDWAFGFGTGLGALDISGDAGFNTQLLGPVEFDASLEPDEVMDYLDSSISLGGFASNGVITVSYAFSTLDLEEDVSATQGDSSGVAEVGFSAKGGQVLVDYAFHKSGSSTWGVVGGLRYSEQEYDAKLSIDNNIVFSGSVEDDWVDAVVGISHSYAFSPTLSWSTQLDYGFGGSEGTTHFTTGLGKVFGESWLVKLAVDFKDIEYEEGEKGDQDWYFYDATETVLGLSVLYLF